MNHKIPFLRQTNVDPEKAAKHAWYSLTPHGGSVRQNRTS
jgi:hypothetical protein